MLTETSPTCPWDREESTISQDEVNRWLLNTGLGGEIGSFWTRIGEEQLTQESFPVPGLDKTVTAVVFYTDEWIRSADGDNSVRLGLAEGTGEVEALFDGPDGATAEFTLWMRTGIVRPSKALAWPDGGRSVRLSRVNTMSPASSSCSKL